MSRYAQGEAQVKEVRNADFLSSVVTEVKSAKKSTAKKKKQK
jgi:hypothetical protein